jgi:hypothetical protein
VHESPLTMLLPIVILGFGSLVVGTLWSPLMEHVWPTFGSHYFQTYLAPTLGQAHAAVAAAAAEHEGPGALHAVHEFNWAPTALGFFAALTGLLIARWFWLGGKVASEAKDLVGFAAWWTWGFDRVYHALFIIPVKIAAWVLAWIVDALLAVIVEQSATISRFFSDGYTSVQRPRLRSSLALSVAGAAGMIAVLLLTGTLAWVVGLAAAAVAVVLLLLEFIL